MLEDPIVKDLKLVLYDVLQRHTKMPIYIAGSGLFTVERLASKAGFSEIYSNDLNLPACLIGWHAVDKDPQIKIIPEDLKWLEEYLNPGMDTIAAVLLFCDVIKYWSGSSGHHKRMYQQYKKHWPRLFTQTKAYLADPLSELYLRDFDPGDPIAFLENAPEEILAIRPIVSKPLNFSLQKLLDQVFVWDKPAGSYQHPQNLFLEQLTKRTSWIYVLDVPIPGLEPQSMIKETPSRQPLNVYSGQKVSRLVLPNPNSEICPIPRLTGEMKGDLDIVPITPKQFGYLRDQFLNKSILARFPDITYAVVVGDKLIGAFGFTASMSVRSFEGCNQPYDAYLLADFPIRPTIYKRLSKLILVAVVSNEVKLMLEQKHVRETPLIGTTVFMKEGKNTSMKYRGLFNMVAEYDDGRSVWVARAGQWSLKDGFEWWKKKHGLVELKEKE
jgi:hypothetical protein